MNATEQTFTAELKKMGGNVNWRRLSEIAGGDALAMFRGLEDRGFIRISYRNDGFSTAEYHVA
jgi:hypothetical protein